MAQNLRARLARIREQRRDPPDLPAPSSQAAGAPERRSLEGSGLPPVAAAIVPSPAQEVWTGAGYQVLRRTLTLPLRMPVTLPNTLPLLLPDLLRGSIFDTADPGKSGAFRAEQFLFFDLETTGLSGGAGTVAFLAAFGRFVPGVSPRTGEFSGLEVTQILLLDYPGEHDFLEAVLSHIDSSGSTPLFLTTYNGKAFDSQILKTRCLMNGLALPSLPQADLLYPARRLWKRILPNCSQATIETMILGLDRSGDTPGSMAPGIWFDFLRAGAGFSGGPETAALLRICDHNVKDIFGLASLFRGFTKIAAAPLDAASRFCCDEEYLALSWRYAARRRLPRKLWNAEGMDWPPGEDLEQTASLLLQRAAKEYPRCCLRLAFDLRSGGRHEDARERLGVLRDWPNTGPPGEKAPGRECTVPLKALALQTLAIDAERQLGRRDLALAYVEEALALEPAGNAGGTGTDRIGERVALPQGLREDLERRRDRLIHSGV
ncbi:MAG: ribonuclease H-like domain-containing protein [Spirochaetaceae bacterium]|jgi:uncharacterized protein YprB with RNaseH-like and TPR domain|nr:ribonuclease H-like domain-containing protein [Spirochaetaceae bacterium]